MHTRIQGQRVVVSAVTAAAAALWIAGIAGCASDSHSHPHWVYMPISRGSSVSAPGVGQKVPSGYSDSKPSSSSKVTTSDRSGGSYSRGSGTRHGGFGSGSKGGSGS